MTGGILTAIAAIVLTAGIFLACHAPAGQTYAKAALVTVDASRAAFLAWDQQHQLDIVAAATSQADGHEKLAAYRKTRDAVTSAMTDALMQIGSAALKDSSDAEIAAAKKAVADLLSALRALGVKV